MFIGKLLLALGMAFLFTLIFSLALKRGRPWSAWWAFFLVVFLAAWAGSLWISPAGPVIVGIYWLPMIYVCFIFAVLLAAMSTPMRPRSQELTVPEAERVERSLDAFFWILLAVLVLAVVLGYIIPTT